MKLAFVVIVLAGCGSDVDLTGTYRVDSDVASKPCGNDQPVTMGDPFLKFHKEDLFGQEYFAYDGCPDETGTNCSSTGLFGGFYEPIDGGWRGVASSSSGSGGQCLLSYQERTAIVAGKRLIIESSVFQDTVTLSADACTTDEAEKRGDSMPCTEHGHTEATKL